MGVMSPVLLSRLEKDLGLTRPSAVQVATYNAIAEGGDVMIGAEAGRGENICNTSCPLSMAFANESRTESILVVIMLVQLH